MTTRKADIQLKARLTAFVSRESGAAELEVSPDTWDEMVLCGLLPPPVMLGRNRTIKRWHWPTVERRLLKDEADSQLGEGAEPYFRQERGHGASKDNKREIPERRVLG
jgi:hypothetical protein